MSFEPKNHISQIRKEKFWIDEDGKLVGRNPLSSDLKDSIEHLSEGLYSKKAHFIFELIQNAEDNHYENSLPALSFHLFRNGSDKVFGINPILLVQNNEKGFEPDNVDAICAVGKSTKTKAQGYIGEKGIGFKSVFRVSTKPFIFSNGYRFCLPEEDEATGLGYIVPHWIEKEPTIIDKSQTNIVLPLDKPDFTFDEIKENLMDITPETILFLSKLKELKIKIQSEHEITIIKNDSKAPLIEILVNKNDKTDIYEYLVYTKSFEKPSHINPENRNKIYEREVTIAFPLSEKKIGEGKIFAYLPVRSDTGLPFIINADFLLPSNREDIKEDEPWNHWLRDCIPSLFIEAFEAWLKITEFSTKIYKFIPVDAHMTFLKPVFESIISQMCDRKIILTQPDGKKCKPEYTRTASEKFRKLLAGKEYPDSLQADIRLVFNELEDCKEQLNIIGVKPLTLSEAKNCFHDRRWIGAHGFNWLLDCYHYLSQQNFDELIDIPIVPTNDGNCISWSCDKEQPIYFERSEEMFRLFSSVPKCARVPLAFLDEDFYHLVKERKTIKQWMMEKLKIFSFSEHNYVVDVLNWFQSNFSNIEVSDFVSLTFFLSQFSNFDIDFSNLPILLSDNRRMLLSEVNGLEGVQAIVTPEELDPETGWQNILISGDRDHLAPISNVYLSYRKLTNADSIEQMQKFWKKLRITPYPLPRAYELEEYEEVSGYELDCIDKSGHSTRTKSIFNFRPFEWLKEFNTFDDMTKLKISLSLINMISNQNLNWAIATVHCFYRSSFRKKYESELLKSLKSIPWLPSTKGFVLPAQAFIPYQHIKEMLGDSVPYFEHTLPDNIIPTTLLIRMNLVPTFFFADEKDMPGGFDFESIGQAQALIKYRKFSWAV